MEDLELAMTKALKVNFEVLSVNALASPLASPNLAENSDEQNGHGCFNAENLSFQEWLFQI